MLSVLVLVLISTPSCRVGCLSPLLLHYHQLSKSGLHLGLSGARAPLLRLATISVVIGLLTSGLDATRGAD